MLNHCNQLTLKHSAPKSSLRLWTTLRVWHQFKVTCTRSSCVSQQSNGSISILAMRVSRLSFWRSMSSWALGDCLCLKPSRGRATKSLMALRWKELAVLLTSNSGPTFSNSTSNRSACVYSPQWSTTASPKHATSLSTSTKRCDDRVVALIVWLIHQTENLHLLNF